MPREPKFRFSRKDKARSKVFYKSDDSWIKDTRAWIYRYINYTTVRFVFLFVCSPKLQKEYVERFQNNQNSPNAYKYVKTLLRWLQTPLDVVVLLLMMGTITYPRYICVYIAIYKENVLGRILLGDRAFQLAYR